MYIYQIMSNSFGYLDIILLGMIAGFIILRLRSILGRKTGHESKVYPNFAEKKFSIPQNDSKPKEKNFEILSKIQRLNLELKSLDEENDRIQREIENFKNSLVEIDNDLDREKSITIDANSNEKMLKE